MNGLDDLAFEFYHFRVYGRLIGTQMEGGNPCGHLVLSQAVGYAFLIHLRILLAFFYDGSDTRDRKQDDLVASDYCMLPEFSVLCADAPWKDRPPWVVQVRKEINKRLAHLTAHRWREAPPDMGYYYRHFGDVDMFIASFERSLPTAFGSKLDAIVKRLASRDAGFLPGI